MDCEGVSVVSANTVRDLTNPKLENELANDRTSYSNFKLGQATNACQASLRELPRATTRTENAAGSSLDKSSGLPMRRCFML